MGNNILTKLQIIWPTDVSVFISTNFQPNCYTCSVEAELFGAGK